MIGYHRRKSIGKGGIRAHLAGWPNFLGRSRRFSTCPPYNAKATKTQTHIGDTSDSPCSPPPRFLTRVSPSVQYLSVSVERFITWECPLYARIGESSQNNKYTVTSDTGVLLRRVFIPALYADIMSERDTRFTFRGDHRRISRNDLIFPLEITSRENFAKTARGESFCMPIVSRNFSRSDAE